MDFNFNNDDEEEQKGAQSASSMSGAFAGEQEFNDLNVFRVNGGQDEVASQA